MAETVVIKMGFSALYLIELSNRAIEYLRASDDGSATMASVEQFDLARTVVNNGADLSI